VKDYIKSYAFGKVMLAGEWAVLDKKHRGLVLGIKKGVAATIGPLEDSALCDGIVVDMQGYGVLHGKIEKNSVVFTGGGASTGGDASTAEDEHKTVFVRQAVATAVAYLTELGYEIRPFHLKIESEISGTLEGGLVGGLGSSSGTVVAVMTSILQFMMFSRVMPSSKVVPSSETKDVVFKLSCIAHYLAQGMLGSGFDVAAAVFGGLLAYRRFDPVWLGRQLKLKDSKQGLS